MENLQSIPGKFFSLTSFDSLCGNISGHDCTLVSYFNNKATKTISRHDIDRKKLKAIDIAMIESKHGVSSSFYFRKSTFDVNICDRIRQMGHEIGYHYESLSQSNGDYEKAIGSFINDLDLFRENFDIKTICMHGSPLSKYDNRLLWNRYDYRDYGIIGDASLDVDNSYVYVTDTGGSWNSKNNLRDKMNSDHLSIGNDYELIQLLLSDKKVYLNTHPERWSDNPWEQLFIKAKDGTFNMGKMFLRTIRRY